MKTISRSPAAPRRRRWSALAALRQWRFPKEFRIGPPIWPSGLSPVMGDLAGTAQPDGRTPGGTPVDAWQKMFADVGTNLWRLRAKMLRPGTEEPLDEMRRAYRHLESIWDAMTHFGIQVHDHTGEVVPEGGVLGLKTVAFQPTEGLGRETVIETIKPSIYLRDACLQMGEVIVGTPLARAAEDGAPPQPSDEGPDADGQEQGAPEPGEAAEAADTPLRAEEEQSANTDPICAPDPVPSGDTNDDQAHG